jgi:uncharacterized RDD family membrane protein YckC
VNPASLAALRPDDEEKLSREILTPEGIPLRFTLARAGDRAAAFALDSLLQVLVIVAVSIGVQLATGGNQTVLTALIVVLSFLLANFYFAFFEVRWQGSTPGKRMVGIRVIDARGGQLETSAVLARNLIRELEVWTPVRFLFAGELMWPNVPGWAQLLAGAWAFAFLFMPVFNKDRLRIGDMIAGTLVVMRPKVVLVPDIAGEVAADAAAAARRYAPAGSFASPLGRPAFAFTEAHLGHYGIFELQVLERLLRGNPLEPSFADAVRSVSEKVRAKIGYGALPSADDERFLREFYAAQRAHLEQKLLFGQRRQDKYAKK